MSDQPFPGLRPFRRDETDVFFGRESSLDIMVDKLAAFRFLAVTGASGSGKSSLVFTGLIDALDRGLLARAGSDWNVVVFRPGSHPLRALADALCGSPDASLSSIEPPLLEATLASGPLSLAHELTAQGFGKDQNILIVADQFEEIFRYRTAGEATEGGPADKELLAWREESQTLVNLLLESTRQASPQIYVVITLRSDYLGDCAAFDGLAEAINDSQFLTPRLAREDIRRAIEGPVRVYGGAIEPALVNHLLNEMGTNPDQLPLMQHAMMRLWEMAPGSPKHLTFKFYEERLKSLQYALSSHLDAVAEGESLTEQQKKIIPIIFRALTEGSGSRNDRRRPTALGTLAAIAEADPSDVISVIDAFRGPGRHFLTPQGALSAASTIDISHESLIRQWDALRKWVYAESRAADEYHVLEFSAQGWKDGHHDLLHGPDLTNALIWFERERPNAAWAARYGKHFDTVTRFIEESRAEEDHRERTKAEQRKAQVRRRFIASVGAIAAVMVVGALAIYHVVTRSADERAIDIQNADIEIQNAEFSVQQADKTLADGDRSAVLPIAVSSIESLQKQKLDPVADKNAVEALQRAWTDLYAASSADWQLSRLVGHTDAVMSVAYSPDGNTIATASADRSVRIWDGADGFVSQPHLVCLLPGEKPNGRDPNWKCADIPRVIAYSPDNRLLAAASYDGGVYLWDTTQSYKLVAWLVPQGSPCAQQTSKAAKAGNECPRLNSVGFAKDNSRRMVTASDNGTATIWNITNPAHALVEKVLRIGHARLTFASLSPDGKRVVAASADENAYIVDVASGKTVRTLRHDGPVNAAVFSPGPVQTPSGENRLLVATASNDRTARLWDAATGTLLHVLSHNMIVQSVAFSADGDRIVTSSNDKAVRIWHTRTGVQLGILAGHDGIVYAAAFSPDEQRIVTASQDKTARLWNGSAFSHFDVLCCHDNAVNSVQYSSDGKQIVSASSDGSIEVWKKNQRWEGRKLVPPITVLPQPVNFASFSHDGVRVVAAYNDGKVGIWNLNEPNPKPIWLPPHRKAAYSAFFSSDDSEVLTASADKTARILVLKNQREVAFQDHMDWVYSAVFSADGRHVVTASKDGTVRVWDTQGHELARMPPKSSPTTTSRFRWAAFSPDGTHVVAASFDSYAYVWDWMSDRSGKSVLRLGPHFDWVAIAAYFVDKGDKYDNWIVTASYNGYIRIWDAESGQLRYVISRPDARTNFVDLHFDASDKHWRAVTAYDDRTIRVWRIDRLRFDDLLAWAKAASFDLPGPRTDLINTMGDVAFLAEERKINQLLAEYSRENEKPQRDAALEKEYRTFVEQALRTNDPAWRRGMATLAMLLTEDGMNTDVATIYRSVERQIQSKK
jgi:WD40 repeat protein